MKVLVTGAWQCTPTEIDYIEKLGHSVVYMQYEKDKLPCDASEIEGVICNGLFLHHDIDQFEKLKYIQLTSAGFDRVPVSLIERRKIKLYNARGVYSVPMAEFAISGVLSLYKQNRFFYDRQREHSWEKHRGLIELYGKTVCVIGCGSVGNECAKRFSAFGCQIFGVDLYPREDILYKKIYGLDELKKCLSKTDVAVLTLPLTDQTYHLFDKDVLSSMKKGSVLVNIARGAVVDSDALREALQNQLGGAVLDVFENEPIDQESFFWDLDNVIITPHNSFVGDGNSSRLCDLIIKNLEEYNENYCCCT